jgi:DUF1680 family protein
MKTPGGGLAAVAYAPCRIETRVRGTSVSVVVDTEYPFRDIVNISINTSEPVAFPILLRIPGWATNAEVSVQGSEVVKAQPGAFYRIEREWTGDTQITLRLPMGPRVERRYHNGVTIHRGPLVYSLRVDEEWRQIAGELPHADWEVHPVSPWNYALAVNLEAPAQSITFEERPLGATPFSPGGAPVVATVQGRCLPDWTLHRNAAAPLPDSPVHSNEPLVELELVPYGCTNLRITEFPVLE